DGVRVSRIESTWYGLEGTVKAADAPKKTLTVVVTSPKFLKTPKWTSEGTLPISPDAPIWIDGKESKLANLKPGMPVALKVTQEQTPRRGLGDVTGIIGVIATSLTIDGGIQEVEAVKRTITASVGGTKVVVNAIALGEGVTVQIDGKGGKVADLKAGMRATLQLAPDPERSLVIGIRTSAMNPAVKPDKTHEREPQEGLAPGSQPRKGGQQLDAFSYKPGQVVQTRFFFKNVGSAPIVMT